MATTEVLAPYVNQVARAVLGEDAPQLDEGGRMTIEADGSEISLRLGDGPGGMPRVILSSVLAEDIEDSPEVLRLLNMLNGRSPFVRFFLDEGRVRGATEVLAESLRAEDLRNALSLIAEAAAHVPVLLEASTTDEVGAGEAAPKSSATPRGLSALSGPTAHAVVPGEGVLKPDPSPADGAMNIRFGYLR